MVNSAYASDVLGSIWRPLSAGFRAQISDATKQAFLGRTWIKAPSGEPVFLNDVLRYNAKAEGPLASTLQTLALADHGKLEKLIEELYPPLVPYFILCGTQNPLHHTAYVLDFMSTILMKEERDKRDIKIGLLAALFHDSGQGLALGEKITELHLEDRIREIVANDGEPAEVLEYRDKAIESRKDHMKQGAELAQRMLRGAPDHQDLMENVIEIVAKHDNPKIPLVHRKIRGELGGACGWLSRHQGAVLNDLMDPSSGSEYLFTPQIDLLQMHHEADLLWMVSQDGIEADLVRFPPTEERKTAPEMLENNVKLHKAEYLLYEELLPNEVSSYGFIDKTAYRTDTGHKLFTHLIS